MNARPKSLLAITGVAASIAVGWVLFGWHAEPVAPGEWIFRRHFGRVTLIQMHSFSDTLGDGEIRFRWNAPFRGARNGLLGDVCLLDFEIYREDRDRDGAWDFEVEPIAASQSDRELRFSVDASGDGVMETQFVDRCDRFDARLAEVIGARLSVEAPPAN